jgi:dGTPase
MGRYGEKFDHNLHALRLVESFEQRYARFPGLNLTFEVREGMVKHSRDISDEDREVLREYLPDCRPPLEGQLIDLADEIAYNTADLDDAYSAGMFSIEDVTAAVPQYGEIRAEIERAYPEASERLIFQEILRRLIDWLVSGLVEGTRDAAERASVGSFDDVRRHGVRLACIEGPAMETNLALKTFLRHNVYYSRPLVEEREAAARQIGELFQYYADQPDRLPEGYREQAHETPVHRVICDYIAGMTDGYFKPTYAQVMGD